MKNIYTKIIFIPIIMIILSNISLSQTNTNDEDIQTLFPHGNIKNGGYGAFEIKWSKINNGDNSIGIWTGGRGGWIINSTFSIGGGGYGLVTNHKLWEKSDSAFFLDAGYGGLFLEYINNSNDIIHFTGNLMIGAGAASFTNKRFGVMSEFKDVTWDNVSSGFMVIEPGINAEINILKWFRIATGISYRIISLLDLKYTFSNGVTKSCTSSDIGGLNINLVFKFGKF